MHASEVKEQVAGRGGPQNGAESYPLADRARSGSMVFICVLAFIDSLGTGIAAPVLPRLLQYLGGGTSAQVATTYAVLTSIGAVTTFLFSPLIGALSDRFGRKTILLVSVAATAATNVVLAGATTFWPWVVTQVLCGVFGCSMIAARAYVADIASESDRAARFGTLNAAFAGGLICGPVLGGMLVAWNVRAPFWLAAGVASVNFCYGLVFLAEGRRPQVTKEAIWISALPLRAFRRIRGSTVLRMMVLALFVDELASSMARPALVFLMQFDLHWTAREVGVAFTVFATAVFLCQGFVTKAVIGALGERGSLWLGMSMLTVFVSLLALVSAPWQVYVVIILIALGTLGGPAAQSIVSKEVSPDEQGALQGTLGSNMVLAGVIGPPLGAWAYAHAGAAPIGSHASSPVFLLAGLISFAAAACAYLATASKRERKSEARA